MIRALLAVPAILGIIVRPGWSQPAKKPASFSEVTLASSAVTAGHPASLKTSIRNDSGQDWTEGAYEVFAVVSQGKKILRRTRPLPIRKALPAGQSKELNLRVAVPEGADGGIAFYVFLSKDGQVVAHSEPLEAKIAGARPAAGGVDAEVADSAASFSGLALGPDGAAAGRAAKLTVSVRNDSGQDWPPAAYAVSVAVSVKDGRVLRKTRPIPISKAVPAGQSKELSLRVAVPQDAAGDVAFQVFLVKDGQVAAQSEPLPASLAGETPPASPAPVAAAAPLAAPAETAPVAAPAGEAASETASAEPEALPAAPLTRKQVEAELLP